MTSATYLIWMSENDTVMLDMNLNWQAKNYPIT